MAELSKQALAEVLRHDFPAFSERTFVELNPSTPYHDNWHIHAMCDVLMRAKDGDVKRAIINVPPRHSKSTVVSVAFPAFLLGWDPSRRIVCTSYAKSLAYQLSNYTRAVMLAPWFPFSIQLMKSTEELLETKELGFRLATSVESGITGKGGSMIIVDDPAETSAATSPHALQKAIDYYNTTLATRLDDQKTGVILIIAQRIHQDDLAGHLLRQGGWEHLQIPARADAPKTYVIGHNETYTTKTGEVLDPRRLGPEELELLRVQLGTANFEAQYQQNPLPPSGQMFDPGWLKTYTELPEISDLVLSIDVAGTKGGGDYSVLMLLGFSDGKWYIIDVKRHQVDLPKLLKLSINAHRTLKPDLIVVDSNTVGLNLYQELHSRYSRVLGRDATRAKAERAGRTAIAMEGGRILVPEAAPWLPAFRSELIAFPDGQFDDQVDSLTQVISREKEVLGHSKLHRQPKRAHLQTTGIQLNLTKVYAITPKGLVLCS